MIDANPHFGSALDDLLEETGELAEVSAIAIECVEFWVAVSGGKSLV